MLRAYGARLGPEADAGLGDYGAVAAALRPDLILVEPVYIDVVLRGEKRGATISVHDKQHRSPVDLVTQIDNDAFVKMWLDTL